MAPQQSTLLNRGVSPVPRDRARGAALVLVLLALILIGGFVAAAFLPALEEIRAGRNTLRLVQAAAAAQGGVEETLAYWSGAGHDTLAVGDSSPVAAAALASRSGWYRGVVYRRGPDMFLVRVQGFSRDSASRHAVGVLMQRRAFETGIQTALAAEGPVVAGSSFVIGATDSMPPGLNDCPAPESGASRQERALVSRDSTVADTMRLVLQRVAHRAASIVRLAPGDYDRVGPSERGGRCLRDEPRNWGDPGPTAGPCADYFPVIDVAGDLGLGGGMGQGVLIVHGGLTLDGGFEFFGPVFVDGPLRLKNARVSGGVLVAGGGAEVLLDHGAIIYSKCVLTTASRSLGEVAPLGQRQWIELP